MNLTIRKKLFGLGLITFMVGAAIWGLSYWGLSRELVGKFKLGQHGGASGQTVTVSATTATAALSVSKAPAKKILSPAAIAMHTDLGRMKVPVSHSSPSGESRFEEF